MAKAITTNDIWGQKGLTYSLRPHTGSIPWACTPWLSGSGRNCGPALSRAQFRWLRVSLSVLRLTPQRGGLLYSHTTHGSFAPHAYRASQQRLTLQRDLNSAPNLAFLKTTYILQRTFCMELLGTHSRITEVPVCRIFKKEIFFFWSFQTQLQSSTSH